jgi:hypothetical protein
MSSTIITLVLVLVFIAALYLYTLVI